MKSTFIKNQFISCLWMFFVCFTCLCQNGKIDSLKSEKLKNRKIKLDQLLFKDLSALPENESEKILNLFNEAELLAKPELGNYLVFINTNRGRLYEKIGQFDKALSEYEKAYHTATSHNDKMGSARALQAKAIFYGKQARYDSTYKYLKKSIEITKENLYNPIVDSTKNKNLLMNLLSNMAMINLSQKKHLENLKYSEESLKMALELKNKRTEAICYSYIADAHKNLNNYSKALYYYEKEKEIAKQTNNVTTLGYANVHISSVLKTQKKFEEAKKLILEALEIFKSINNVEGYQKAKSHLFTLYRLSKDYKNALLLKDEVINLAKSNKNDESLAHIYIELGEIYTVENNLKDALRYFEFAKEILDKNPNYSKKEYYSKYSNYLKIKGEINEALNIKTKEILVQNEEINPEFVNKMAELEIKFKVTEKESKIAQQQLQIEKETNRRNLAIGSVGLVLFLSFGGFLWFRNKQKNKELQNQNTLLSLQQNLNEMELSNLNKQLDPHEIKNLLASISPEIQDKAPEAYKKMIKLLNITKAGLNSNSLTEAVENQVKQIDDFLSLEKQMSSKQFEYEISNQIKDTSVKIPRLLLKNLVENSVKHGIRKKENGGKIEVQLVEKDNHLYVTVDDTGIGRKFAISQDSGIGTSTYIKLFETLNKRNNKPAAFEILDKVEGTRVEVRIPKEYKYE